MVIVKYSISSFLLFVAFSSNTVYGENYFPFKQLHGKWEWSTKENACEGEPHAEIIPNQKENKLIFITPNGSKIDQSATVYKNLTYMVLTEGLLATEDNKKYHFSQLN